MINLISILWEKSIRSSLFVWNLAIGTGELVKGVLSPGLFTFRCIKVKMQIPENWSQKREVFHSSDFRIWSSGSSPVALFNFLAQDMLLEGPGWLVDHLLPWKSQTHEGLLEHLKCWWSWVDWQSDWKQNKCLFYCIRKVPHVYKPSI